MSLQQHQHQHHKNRPCSGFLQQYGAGVAWLCWQVWTTLTLRCYVTATLSSSSQGALIRTRTPLVKSVHLASRYFKSIFLPESWHEPSSWVSGLVFLDKVIGLIKRVHQLSYRKNKINDSPPSSSRQSLRRLSASSDLSSSTTPPSVFCNLISVLQDVADLYLMFQGASLSDASLVVLLTFVSFGMIWSYQQIEDLVEFGHSFDAESRSWYIQCIQTGYTSYCMAVRASCRNEPLESAATCFERHVHNHYCLMPLFLGITFYWFLVAHLRLWRLKQNLHRHHTMSMHTTDKDGGAKDASNERDSLSALIQHERQVTLYRAVAFMCVSLYVQYFTLTMQLFLWGVALCVMTISCLWI